MVSFSMQWLTKTYHISPGVQLKNKQVEKKLADMGENANSPDDP